MSRFHPGRKSHWTSKVLNEQRDKKWLVEQLQREKLPIPADLKAEIEPERHPIGFTAQL